MLIYTLIVCVNLAEGTSCVPIPQGTSKEQCLKEEKRLTSVFGGVKALCVSGYKNG